jgi:hypothetical protein
VDRVRWVDVGSADRAAQPRRRPPPRRVPTKRLQRRARPSPPQMHLRGQAVLRSLPTIRSTRRSSQGRSGSLRKCHRHSKFHRPHDDRSRRQPKLQLRALPIAQVAVSEFRETGAPVDVVRTRQPLQTIATCGSVLWRPMGSQHCAALCVVD